MSEAMHPDRGHDVLPFTKPSGEALERTDSLLGIDDTSLSNDTIDERLMVEVDQKELTSLDTRDERSRYFINTALIVAGVTYHFADLRAKDRRDAIHTLAVTKLISEAERHLANVEAQDGIRHLTNELFEIYEAAENTNLIRTITQLEKRYQSKYAAELVKAKRIALLALAKPQSE